MTTLTEADRKLASGFAGPLETAHGITRIGMCKVSGRHLSAAPNESVTHALSRESHNGSGLDGYIVPVCSCGWKGRPEYAYEDYQYTNLREQEDAHTRGCK